MFKSWHQPLSAVPSRNYPNISICKIFGVVRFSTFSTVSAQSGSFGEPTITLEAKAWLTSLSCRKAKELGYPHELWTTRLLVPPRSRARSRGRAPMPGEHENDRRASSRQIGLAQAQGEGAQILAIERHDVEGIRLDFVIVLARVQDIEIGNTVNAEDDSFAINELICSTLRATRRIFQTSQT
jgi:hypothetical protein